MIADSTLVIIFDDRDRRAPFADHYEMSINMVALYDNWSVLANTTRHLRFHRVVLFRNRGGRLLGVADTVVATEEGGTVLVRSNTGRVRPGPPTTTRTWRHIAPRGL